jgi:hypothetical protein
MSTHYCYITIWNDTDHDFEVDKNHPKHRSPRGGWSAAPPDKIKAGETITLELKGDAPKGASGEITYRIGPSSKNEYLFAFGFEAVGDKPGAAATASVLLAALEDGKLQASGHHSGSFSKIPPRNAALWALSGKVLKGTGKDGWSKTPAVHALAAGAIEASGVAPMLTLEEGTTLSVLCRVYTMREGAN